MRASAVIACAAAVIGLSACGEYGEGESEPTFEQARNLAEEQLAGAGCEFQVEDTSTEKTEQMSLSCLTSEDGEAQVYTVMRYSRQVEESEFPVGNLVTAEHYFENGNITVEPAGGADVPVQLDAEAYATALEEECGCGTVESAGE